VTCATSIPACGSSSGSLPEQAMATSPGSYRGSHEHGVPHTAGSLNPRPPVSTLPANRLSNPSPLTVKSYH
jgi:hypothetical protein